jgi:hypothetical protein
MLSLSLIPLSHSPHLSDGPHECPSNDTPQEEVEDVPWRKQCKGWVGRSTRMDGPVERRVTCVSE